MRRASSVWSTARPARAGPTTMRPPPTPTVAARAGTSRARATASACARARAGVARKASGTSRSLSRPTSPRIRLPSEGLAIA